MPPRQLMKKTFMDVPYTLLPTGGAVFFFIDLFITSLEYF